MVLAIIDYLSIHFLRLISSRTHPFTSIVMLLISFIIIHHYHLSPLQGMSQQLCYVCLDATDMVLVLNEQKWHLNH
jgi:hypothetical protein